MPHAERFSNHHIIPHNGRNMTNSTLFPAFTSVLNLRADVANNLVKLGISTTSNPNGTSFDFTDINRHGPIEDDVSLSRKDVYFGDAVTFDNYTWAQTKSFYTEPIIDIQHAADARVARLYTSNWTKTGAPPSTMGTLALFMNILGDPEAGTVKRSFVKYFFQQEKLPYELGWRRGQTTITGLVFGALQARLAAAIKDHFPLPDNFQQADL